jgi:ABC-type antimicrobial peptide transport system permease subunit
MSIAIRGGGPGIDQAARRELEAMGRQYVIKSAPLTQWIRQRILRERMLATVSSVFGMMTVGVAGVGLYGLIAFIVASRTRELSIRMAIGAQRKDIGWLIAREILIVATTGLAAGFAGSVAAARLVDAYVFGVQALDPSALAIAVILLAAVTAAAAYMPARRAIRLDPAQALRSE